MNIGGCLNRCERNDFRHSAHKSPVLAQIPSASRFAFRISRELADLAICVERVHGPLAVASPRILRDARARDGPVRGSDQSRRRRVRAHHRHGSSARFRYLRSDPGHGRDAHRLRRFRLERAHGADSFAPGLWFRHEPGGLVGCRAGQSGGDGSNPGVWRPVWHVLEDRGVYELMLVNPRHVKNLPNRKTDVGDASWLGQLLECGLLRAHPNLRTDPITSKTRAPPQTVPQHHPASRF